MLPTLSMRVGPLIERELRASLRRENPWRSRFRQGGVAVGICALMLLGSVLFDSPTAGRGIKNLLLFFGIFICLQLPGQVAGLIAAERRQQTLDLLFLTGLRPTEVFLGKLTGALVLALGNLLVLMPLLALPFLMGGVNFETFLAVATCLPVSLFWIVALSLFLSCLAKNEEAAYLLTVWSGAVWCGLAPLAWLGTRWLSADAIAAAGDGYGWLVTSPALGPWLAYQGLGAKNAAAFWTNQILTVGATLALLVGATRALPWRWRRDSNRGAGGTQHAWSRVAERLAGFTATHRRAWLEENPALWLELHRNRPVLTGWLVLGVVCLLWLAGWAVFRGMWLGSWNFFLTALALNGGILMVAQHATAAGMAEGRHTGNWELVLTTPLPPKQIVSAVEAAPRLRFRRLSQAAFVFLGLVAGTALASREWSPTALLNFGLIAFTLLVWTWHAGRAHWVPTTAWVALNSGRTWMALTGGGNYKVLIGYLIFTSMVNVRSCAARRMDEPSFPTGSVAETCLVVFLFIIFWLIVMAYRNEHKEIRDKLITEFREIVREPVPAPDDPRFEQWREPGKTRFPWGPERFADQIADRMARRREEGWSRREAPPT